MSAILAFCFLVIFTLLLFSISFGLRFYEGKRRKRLVSMLRTVTESGEEHHVNLLIEDSGNRDPVESLLGSLNIVARIKKLLSESGLDWTPSRLVISMSVAFAIGAVASGFIPTQQSLVLQIGRASV